MRRYKTIVGLLTVCALLFTGCGLRAGKTGEAGPSPAAAKPAATETPAGTPTPPSTVPDTPAPEKNGMYDLLAQVFDNYHFGPAGSSLVAAGYAAEIVDWGMSNGAAAVRAGASAWDRGMTNEYGEDLTEKLSGLYYLALSFYGRGTAVLSDCGWEGKWHYTAGDVQRVYQELFPALGAETPLFAVAFAPDEEVQYLRAEGLELDKEDMADPVRALNTLLNYRTIPREAAVLTADVSDGVLTLDMNDAFAQYVRSMGTSGEMLTVAAVVNTALCLYEGAESVRITVGGGVLETGHEIYDYPMTFHEEQTI